MSEENQKKKAAIAEILAKTTDQRIDDRKKNDQEALDQFIGEYRKEFTNKSYTEQHAEVAKLKAMLEAAKSILKP